MITLRDAKLTLSQTGWLCQTPPGFRDAVLGRSMLRQFAKNERIYDIGDDAGGMWGLAEGGLAIHYAEAQSQPGFVHYALPGFWTGDYSVVTGQPRIIGLRATRPTTCLYLARPAFLEIAAKDPEAWRWVSLRVMQHMALTLGYMRDLATPNAARRVASILLRLAGQQVAPGEAKAQMPVEIDISQETLGEFCNVSRAAMSEILRRLTADGAIEPGYRCIVVTAADGLWARLA